MAKLFNKMIEPIGNGLVRYRDGWSDEHVQTALDEEFAIVFSCKQIYK